MLPLTKPYGCVLYLLVLIIFELCLVDFSLKFIHTHIRPVRQKYHFKIEKSVCLKVFDCLRNWSVSRKWTDLFKQLWVEQFVNDMKVGICAMLCDCDLLISELFNHCRQNSTPQKYTHTYRKTNKFWGLKIVGRSMLYGVHIHLTPCKWNTNTNLHPHILYYMIE